MGVESQPRERLQTSTEKDPMWQVVVLNDPVNLMSYVVHVFRKVLGFSPDVARKHMLEVHEQGRSVVWVGSRERAEAYTLALQGWQLLAKLEPALS